MWRYEWELLTVCHYPANFGGHRHCGSGDEMPLIFRVISQDYVIQEA